MGSFKAMVKINGAVTQNLFAKNLDNLRAKAIKSLTFYEPGFASLTPESITLLKHRRRISGNKAEWMLLEVIKFTDIPEDQHEWRKRKQLRLDAKQPPC